MTHGMESGVWTDLYGGTGVAAGITAFALVYTLSALGAAVNGLSDDKASFVKNEYEEHLGDFE